LDWMVKERLKSPRARLFVALDLPPSVRLRIGAWGWAALDDPALRRETPTSLHITLAFLGYRAEREIERLAATVRARTRTAPSVELRDPVARPPRGRPRLFALPADSPAVMSLQADLQQRLVEERLYDPERRPFWPHVTVARVRPEGRGSRRPRRVSRQPGGLPQDLLQPIRCVRMTLYRSELQPQGALYTPLAQVELSEGGRQ
jgi:RNA 2',3'-cyclic 3'-phosphodiesterase